MINRINLILKIKNLTASQFADEVGVQRSNMSHIISGRNNPSLDFISKVLVRYPDICTDWLLFGKGEMFATDRQSVVKKQEHKSNELNLFPEEFAENESDNNDNSELKQEEVFSSLLESEMRNKQAFVNENDKNREEKKDVEKYTNLVENKKIKKIMILYTDNTFEEFVSNNL